MVSAASAWEITTKHRLGKLPGANIVAGDVMAAIEDHGFEPLPITVAHAERAHPEGFRVPIVIPSTGC